MNALSHACEVGTDGPAALPVAPAGGAGTIAPRPVLVHGGARHSISAGLSALMIVAAGCATPTPVAPADSPEAAATDPLPSPLGLPARRVATVVGELAVVDSGPTAPASDGAHVLVLWPSILADHRMYRAQVAAWTPRHRVVLIDGPGHGASGPAPGEFSLAECAQAQAQVLDALGIAAPVVSIGTSWGGLVAGEFAIRYPERTAAIAMLNTPVFAAERSFGERFVAWGARWMHAMNLYIDGVARAFFLPETRERGGDEIDDFRTHLREADGAALATAVRSVLIEREPLAPRMRQIRAPALMVAGTQDGMYPSARLRESAAQLPNGWFVELPTSHISVVDAPQAVTRAVDDFLSRL
ncbi:MAG: alpha/beta hydrolase [Burkholderiaceae bacterium]